MNGRSRVLSSAVCHRAVWRAAGRIALVVSASGLVAILAASEATAAAGPSPPPAVPTVRPDATTEIWLDVPLDDAAAAGTMTHVAMTVWDAQRRQLSDLAITDARLLPKAGTGAATTGTARADWPGHLVLDIEVPVGGLGELQIGYPGQVCAPGSDCVPAFVPFVMGGIGPPPDAPTSGLVATTIELRPDPPQVGQPVTTIVRIVPKGAWPVELLHIPPAIELGAGPAGEPAVAVAMLHHLAGPDEQFQGTLTLPAPGEIGLTARIPADRGQDDVLAVRRIDVRSAPDLLGAATDASGQGPLPVLLIVMVVAGLAVMFAASRFLADL